MSAPLIRTAPQPPVPQRERPHVPLFAIELGETERGTRLLIDLFSPRWQALLQCGPPAATAFFWQQVIRSLAERHRYPEVQVHLFTQRADVFAWHLLDWDPHWLVTAYPAQFIQAVFRAYESRPQADAPPLHLFLVDGLPALLEPKSQWERWLQVAFLEGSRHGLRLMGSLNTPGALLPEQPLSQCFTHTVRYLGGGWYGLERLADVLRFRLSIREIQLPEDAP